ncbi:6.4 kDA protein, ubiquinol-cytochrome c reductase, partial [Diachasma alloeum]
IPSATLYGGVGSLAFLYFSDWRLIVDLIPIYNGKFKD